jgi:hypothetical protein
MPAPRELPARPNLDHLKNEAKSLRRAHARGDADAAARVRAAIGSQRDVRLLDAQRVIANEYGYAKWSELRDVVKAKLNAANSVAGDPIKHPLTTRAQVAIAIARGVAGAYGYTGASRYHVALGVLREGENAAVGALQRAGVPLRELRRALERELPSRGNSVGIGTSLDASTEELALIALAKDEAIERGRSFIASEHLFLALLRSQESNTGGLFANHGITYENFSQHLESVLSGV